MDFLGEYTMRWNLSLLAVTAVAAAACSSEKDSLTSGSPLTDMGVAPPTASPTAPPTGTPTAPPTAAPSAGGCADLDRDGYQDKACNANAAGSPRGGDCDDRNNLVSPARAENCANQLDDNCNGMINDGCAAACEDLDHDGFQSAACNANPANGADCDDNNRNINPGASEVCGNFGDDDCQGGDLPCLQNCTDNDHDGYGEGSGCFGPDCDDTNARRNPGVAEVCGDNVDQDCADNVANNPALRGDLPCPMNCQDTDHDGFGVGAGCLGSDCNDSDSNQNTGAREIPGDMIDQDCNGQDLQLGADCTDRDRDGYGEGTGCLGQDCDDGDPRVNPGRDEVCGNRKDDDCMGGDRGCSPAGNGDCTDADGDGYGPGCLRGTVDCDDNNQMVFPDAAEVCNGIDDNCNGETDECGRRGQRCVDDACVSGPGAPCRNDAECDPIQGLRCDPEASECRVADGSACEESAQCSTGAECLVLDACNPDGLACYQAKGGPCAEDCDCTGIYLCHPSNVCVECLGDAQCDGARGEVCTPGGFCALDGTLSGDDHRVSLLQVLVDCWSLYVESTEVHACATLTLPDPLFVGPDERAQIGPADNAAIADFACDSDALSAAGFSQDDIDVLTELFGCGLFDVENLWWRDALNAGSSGDWCVYYAPAKSGFGIPDDARAAVVIDNCSLSDID